MADLSALAELQTDRAVWDCVRQWRRRKGNKKGWTKEQDNKLREAVKMYGESWQNSELLASRFRRSLDCAFSI